MTKYMINKVLDILKETYPDAACALDHQDSFQLLVATVLSAQTTDKSVNKVSPELFRRFPTAEKMSGAASADIEEIIKTIGMYKTKAKNLIGLSTILENNFAGQVPPIYEELISLPGVGRKTANVVLSVAFKQDRIAVDTHVFRVANRIGLANGKDVLTTEKDLMRNIAQKRWGESHHSMIFHGRNICHARKPQCEICPISNYCKYFRDILQAK